MNAATDLNHAKTIAGVSSANGVTIIVPYVDPVTHRLYVNSAGGGTGTVTSVSVVSANGLAGTVANATTTPAITLSTTVTGVLKGNGTAISAAVGDTDFQNPISLTTTGTSGAATFIGDVLNIPQYSSGGGSGTVTNVASADGSITVTNPTSTVDLAVAKSPKLTTGRTISITGDLAYTSPSFDGSGNVTAAGTLATVNSNVGTFGSATQSSVVTVNGKGLVTAASNTTVTPAVGSITGLGTGVATFLATPTSANLATAITDETGTGALVFANTPTLTTAVLGSSTATTQAPSDNSTKVATTAYVDTAVLGQNFKEAALVATTANLVGVYVSGVFTYTATGTDNIDGVNLVLGNRVLVKNQTTTFQNGIYTVTTAGSLGVAGVLTRSSDANTSGEFKTGDSIFVTSGTVNSTTTWAYTGVDSPTLGTDAITYAQVAGQGSFTAGNGIAITGNSIAIDTSVTVDKTTAQTLTNKTLTSPVLTTPNIGVATGTSLAASGVLSTGANSGTNGQITFNGSTSGSVTLKSAAAAGTGTNFQLPATNGSNTNVLQTDGSGNTSWVPAGTGSGTVNSGTATQVAYYATSTNAVSGSTQLLMNPSSGGGSLLTIGDASDHSGGTTDGKLLLRTYNGPSNSVNTYLLSNATTASDATITLPGVTAVLVGRATTDTLTNKTYDTAGTGNSFLINGVAVTANQGTGAVVRATSPTLTTPTLGAATATTINGNTFTTGTYTLTGTAAKTLEDRKSVV